MTEETIKVFMPNYTVTSNTKEETKIVEAFQSMTSVYMKEFAIKKDRAFISTWLNALGDKELFTIYMMLDSIMKERGININSVYIGDIKIKESEEQDERKQD